MTFIPLRGYHVSESCLLGRVISLLVLRNCVDNTVVAFLVFRNPLQQLEIHSRRTKIPGVVAIEKRDRRQES